MGVDRDVGRDFRVGGVLARGDGADSRDESNPRHRVMARIPLGHRIGVALHVRGVRARVFLDGPRYFLRSGIGQGKRQRLDAQHVVCARDSTGDDGVELRMVGNFSQSIIDTQHSVTGVRESSAQVQQKSF